MKLDQLRNWSLKYFLSFCNSLISLYFLCGINRCKIRCDGDMLHGPDNNFESRPNSSIEGCGSASFGSTFLLSLLQLNSIIFIISFAMALVREGHIENLSNRSAMSPFFFFLFIFTARIRNSLHSSRSLLVYSTSLSASVGSITQSDCISSLVCMPCAAVTTALLLL